MMRRIGFYLAALAVVFTAYGIGTLAKAAVMCPTEDSDNCVWDARVQGNGEGHSFVNIGGEVFYFGG